MTLYVKRSLILVDTKPAFHREGHFIIPVANNQGHNRLGIHNNVTLYVKSSTILVENKPTFRREGHFIIRVGNKGMQRLQYM